MSSLRNAVSRRPHKERSQPASRSKWGLLEKHKDYSLRAADYNTKKQKLAQLSRKVKEKHPDEFAYGMVSKSQGKHGKGGDENRLGHDAVKLLKTQDQGYLRVVMSRGRKEIQKVQVEMGGGEGKGRKVVFAEKEGEALEVVGSSEVPNSATAGDDKMEIDEEEDEEDLPVKPKSKQALLAERDTMTRLRAERKRRRRLQEVRATKLEMLKRRQKEIMAAADQLELQRAKMAKSIGGVNKNGVKFKIRERKR